MRSRQSSLLVLKFDWLSGVKKAPLSPDSDCRLMVQSPSAGENDVSSARSSEIVMMVPDRRFASRGSLANTNVSVTSRGPAPASESSSAQPRTSRLSSTTTSSNQSPPLPKIEPKKESPSWMSSSLLTAFHSFKISPGRMGAALVVSVAAVDPSRRCKVRSPVRVVSI